MFSLALTALLSLAIQDPPAAIRVAVQADGSATILRQDGTPPQPLFGRLLGAHENDSLFAAFSNQGLLGNLGLFLGAPRPLSTMLDAERYCEQAGIKRAPEELIRMLRPLAKETSSAVLERRALDRLVALTLLAHSTDPAARRAVADAQKSDDRFAAAWARQLLGEGPRHTSLRDEVAAALANAPADTQIVVVVDHARLPRWQAIWRIAAEAGRAVSRRDVAEQDMPPDEAAAAIAEADLVIERTGLLAYEMAHRVGNAIVERTIVAAPAAVGTGAPGPWLHLGGAFEPDRVARGLRAEGFAITVSDSAVQAVSATETQLRATSTMLAIDATGATERLGPERAKAIAADVDVPHLVLSVSLLSEQAIGMQVPDPYQRLVSALRTIHLRHDPSDGAHLWLDLRYTDPKPATVAATALGALLTAATGAAGDAPQQVREALREIKVSRAGAVVTAEVELDSPLGAWLEALFSQIFREGGWR